MRAPFSVPFWWVRRDWGVGFVVIPTMLGILRDVQVQCRGYTLGFGLEILIFGNPNPPNVDPTT